MNQPASKPALQDAVLLLFRVKKAIEENPNAKFFQIRKYERCKMASNLKFESGRSTPVFDQSKEYPFWYVVKLFVPITNEIKILAKAKDNKDRVGVTIPTNPIVEIDTSELPDIIKDNSFEYFKNQARYDFNFNHHAEGLFFYLSNYNWEVNDEEPGEQSFYIKL